MRPEWTDFVGGKWESEINVRDFIQKNYHPYDGDEAFLAGPTQNTKDLWEQVLDLQRQEREAGGVLDMDTKVVSTIVSHGPGYLNKDKETIVGFQTDKPFKRSLQPYGGIRMAEKACSDNGYEVDPEISEFFSIHRKTHNAGCFDAYNADMRACRSSHIITGLPDAYGRGRIIGDYRRVALYGIDKLIEFKMKDKLDSGEVSQAAKYVPYLEIVFGTDYEIIPALVLTAAKDFFDFVAIGKSDSVLPVCSGDMLFNVFDEYLGFLSDESNTNKAFRAKE